MANLKYETIEPPYNGIDSESAADQVERGYAPTLENFIPGRKGRAPIRSGFHNPTPNMFATSADYQALWWSRNSTLGTALISRAGSTTIEMMDLNAAGIGGSDFAVGNTGLLPVNMHISIGAHVYGKNANGFLTRWEGGTALTAYANGGEHIQAITYWLDRLWTWGGKPAGAASPENTLRWSDQVFDGTALPDTVAAWQDNVSGLINRIQWARPLKGHYGSPTIDNEIGFARLPSGLVVFDNLQMDFVRGNTINNLVVQYNVSSHAPINRHCVVEYNQGMVFLASTGLYFWDGSQEIDLSRAIRHELADMIRVNTATVTTVGRDYIYVQFWDGAASIGYLLHFSTGTWSTVVNAAHHFRAVHPAVTSYGNPTDTFTSGIAYDGQRLWGLHPMLDSGADYIGGDQNDPTDPNDTVPIVASTTLRHLFLSSPMESAAIHRATLDVASPNSAVVNYSIILHEAGDDHTQLDSGASGTTDGGAGSPQRVVVDVFRETNELEITIVLTTQGTEAQAHELREVGVAYQVTAEQRTI